LAINLLNSSIPVFPLTSIQDVFRTQAFFRNYKDNPFITAGIVDVERLNELHEKYFSFKTDFYNTLENLNNMTSREDIFDVIEIGYYGNNRMCIHNVFMRQDSYLAYKLIYFTMLLTTVMTVSITYPIILCKKIKSHRRLGKMGAAADQNRLDEISSMKVKIFLMIGTQLLSWLSFILVAGCYQFLHDDPPSLTFEVFALVVIPVNSVLNPIFYSGLYTKIRKFLWEAWRKFVGKIESICTSDELPVELQMDIR
jgi:hypothetical protein